MNKKKTRRWVIDNYRNWLRHFRGYQRANDTLSIDTILCMTTWNHLEEAWNKVFPWNWLLPWQQFPRHLTKEQVIERIANAKR